MNITSNIEYKRLSVMRKQQGYLFFLLTISLVITFSQEQGVCGCFLTESFFTPQGVLLQALTSNKNIFLHVATMSNALQMSTVMRTAATMKETQEKCRFRMHNQANKQNLENTSMLFFDFRYAVVTPIMHKVRKKQFLFLPLT